jgi:hypothetical protein
LEQIQSGIFSQLNSFCYREDTNHFSIRANNADFWGIDHFVDTRAALARWLIMWTVSYKTSPNVT